MCYNGAVRQRKDYARDGINTIYGLFTSEIDLSEGYQQNMKARSLIHCSAPQIHLAITRITTLGMASNNIPLV